MTPLERLGLEVAARSLLGGRGQAAMLTCLLHAAGAAVAYEALWVVGTRKVDAADPKKAAMIRMCWLRSALDDVGLGGLIVTVERHGYALPEPGRTAVIARLIEEAETC